MKKLLTFILINLLLSSLLLAQAKNIKLGYALDLSARGAFIGEQSRNGALLAVKELKARGIPIEIIFEDHQTQPQQALSAAKKLISWDRVDALLCDLAIPCFTASSVAKEAKKLFIFQAPAPSILKDNPYGFLNFLDYRAGCKAIAKEWSKRGYSNIANIKVHSEFGEDCLAGSNEASGDIKNIEYNSGDELRSIITKIKNQGVVAAIQTGFERDYIERLHAQAALSYPLKIGFPEPLFTNAVKSSVPQEYFKEALAFGFQKLDPLFINKLKAANLYRDEVNIESAAIGYMHVMQVSQAMLECPEKDINCLTDAFSRQQSPALLGFHGWKDRKADYTIKLKEFKAGEFTEISDISQQ